MIGDLCDPPKLILKPRQIPKLVDVPGTKANDTGYVAGREPGSDYKMKLMQYEQRKREFADRKIAIFKKDIADDTTNMKFMIHSEKRAFRRDVKVRVDKKMKEYEAKIEERREKLLDLFWKEDREYMREAIDQAQKGEDYKYQQMELKAAELKARREAERQELANQKKIQQYVNNCDDFRPLLYQRRLMEAKETQLKQIKENESRRESERELDKFWHQMMVHELEARNERDKQDRLHLKRSMDRNLETWKLQEQEKAIRDQILEREKKEDCIMIENLKEELLKEKIRDLDEKRRKRDTMLREVKEAIKKKEELMKRRNDEEISVVRAYEQLVVEEIEKEKKDKKALQETSRREMQQFLDYLKILEEERKEEERILDCLVEKARVELEEKKHDADCKLEYARRALKKCTMEGLAVQVEHKKQVVEQQLKAKEAENEMLRFYYDQNQRLKAEHDRNLLLNAKNYQGELLKQIEYAQIRKEREKEEIERQLKLGMEEEEKFRKIAKNLIDTGAKPGLTHPFRRVIERGVCECPIKENQFM